MKRYIYLAVLLLIPVCILSANAQNGTAHGVELSFGSVTGATSYNIYRCPGTCTLTSTTWAKINTVATATYLDPSSGLTVSTSYSYAVTALNPTGNESAYSNIFTITTPASFPVNPTAPTGLTAAVQ